MESTDARETRLPKWAQEQLHTLRMRLHAERKLSAELRGDIPDANTFVVGYGRKDWPLPRDARVAFHTRPDDGRLRQSIQVYVERGVLQVQGDYSLILLPSASNSFRVALDHSR